MTETRPPYGNEEEPKGGMVGIRLEADDLAVLDHLRGEETRAGYARPILVEGLARKLEEKAAALRKV